MAGELGPVVEGDRLAQRRRQWPQHPGDGLGDRARRLRTRPHNQQEARAALLQNQQHRPGPSEQHQVGLPVAEALAVSRRRGAFGDRSAVRDEGGRAAPLAPPPAALPLRPWQIAPPSVVLVPGRLSIDEPVDTLVGDHRPPCRFGQVAGNLLGRPPPTETFEDAGAQLVVAFEAGAGPAARPGLLMRVHRSVPAHS